jgi:hypothetical protein
MVATTQLTLFDVYDYIPAINPAPVPDRLCVGRFLHLGAGIQSSTMAEMIVEGELDRVDAVLFADTGNEPPWVYEQVWYLAGRLASINIPLIISMKSTQGIMLDSMPPGERFATMPLYTLDPKTGTIGKLRRECTSEYKIEPTTGYTLDWLVTQNHAKRIVDKNGVVSRRVSRQIYIEEWFGISLDEFSRAGRNRGAKWQRAVYPLIERRMKRVDCIQWLKAHGLRVPRKSSCIICPFHDADFWIDLADNYPAIFEMACAFDDWLRTPAAKTKIARKLKHDAYLHPSCKPLRDKPFLKYQIAPELCGDHCHV